MRNASRCHAPTITAALIVVLAQGVASPPACAARSTGAAPAPAIGDRVDAPRADAERLADRLLHAVGGRANWARVTTLVNDSRQYRATPPHEVRAVISIDLERPRFRIETTAPDLHLVRVVDGDTDWRLTRGGAIERVPAETRAEDLRWYAGHVYRTLHRLAKRDPLLRLGVGADGRLEVYEDGARIAWYRLDARGEPYAYGGAGDDPGSVSGPWTVVREGIRHPAWNARVDGTWRAVLDRLEVGVPLDSSAFARPDRILALDSLRGSWRGRGRFQDRPADIDIEVTAALGGAWHRLAVAIRGGADGTERFDGEALYRRGVDGLAATWFDSSGASYPVAGSIEADCLVAQWTTATGVRARSRYCLPDGRDLRVVDEIAGATGWVAFGEYTLSRDGAPTR